MSDASREPTLGEAAEQACDQMGDLVRRMKGRASWAFAAELEAIRRHLAHAVDHHCGGADVTRPMTLDEVDEE